MTPIERLFLWWRRKNAPAPLHSCEGDPCLICVTLRAYQPKAVDDIFTSKPMLWALRQWEEEEE